MMQKRGLTNYSGDKAALAYAESYLALKILLDHGGYPAVLSYLRSLGQGVSPGKSLQKVFGINHEELEKSIGQQLASYRQKS